MTKEIRIYDKTYKSLLNYPFKSKYKSISSMNPLFYMQFDPEPFVKDYKLKVVKKLSKPTFSYEPGCYEIDLMHVKYYENKDDFIEKNSTIYFFMINVNTRFLYVIPIKDKSSNEVFRALSEIIYDSRFQFNTIKCDGEKAFISIANKLIVIKTSSIKSKLINIVELIERIVNLRSFHRKGKKDIINDYIASIFDNKSHSDALKALKKFDLYFYNHTEKHIYDDLSDVSFIPNLLLDLDNIKSDIIDFNPIKFIINKSPYTLSHKIVDSVMQTIRNAFGINDQKIADPDLMKQMIYYYNNTPHRSLKFTNYNQIDSASRSKYIYYTPNELQNDIDLEWIYIRKMKMLLKRKQEELKLKGLLNYKKGNIILIHLDKGKILKKHEKQRRIFNEIAEFITYLHGNVVCRLLNPYQIVDKDTKQKNKFIVDNEKDLNSTLEIPLLYTKFVSDSIESIPNNIKEYFVLKHLNE